MSDAPQTTNTVVEYLPHIGAFLGLSGGGGFIHRMSKLSKRVKKLEQNIGKVNTTVNETTKDFNTEKNTNASARVEFLQRLGKLDNKMTTAMAEIAEIHSQNLLLKQDLSYDRRDQAKLEHEIKNLMDITHQMQMSFATISGVLSKNN